MGTKVYLIEYNNGELYEEDYLEWVDNNVYINWMGCALSLIHKGYKIDRIDEVLGAEVFKLDMGEDRPYRIAMIRELNVAGEPNRSRRQ